MYKHSFIVYLFFILIYMLCVSCAIEKPTPPGQISESNRSNVSETQNSFQASYTKPSDKNSNSTSVSDSNAHPGKGYGVWDENDGNDNSDKTNRYPSQVEQGFVEVYKNYGSPRLLVFLNREFSSDVSSWTSNNRVAIDQKSSQTYLGTSNTQTNLSVQTRVLDQGQGKDLLNETSLWELEEGFMEIFYNTGCRLVDRNTIIRLAALDKEEVDRGNFNFQSLESTALKDNADILIELIYAESKTAVTGIEIRAKATSIKDGQLFAMVTTQQAEKFVKIDNEYIATKNGFEKKVAGIKEMGRIVSVLLMDNLTDAMMR